MSPLATLSGDRIFRPDAFFLGRTEGSGVVRDLFGRIVRRCDIVTRGERRKDNLGVSFDETFTYQDGEVDTWRWTMGPGSGGRYVAAEMKAGAGIVGVSEGEDFVLSFRRPVGRARGLAAPLFTTRFTLLAPDLALKTVKVSLLGAPVGTMTAFQRRLADPATARAPTAPERRRRVHVA